MIWSHDNATLHRRKPSKELVGFRAEFLAAPLMRWKRLATGLEQPIRIVELHPNLPDLYRKKIIQLEQILDFRKIRRKGKKWEKKEKERVFERRKTDIIIGIESLRGGRRKNTCLRS